MEVFNFGYEDQDSGTPVTSLRVGEFVRFLRVSGTHAARSGVASVPVPALGDVDSPILSASSPTYEYEATSAGVFVYTCIFHPSMQGVLVVEP